MKTTEELLKELMKQKILVLDGAMGTMIQTYKLTEADYRGETFKSHTKELKGLNDLLCLTKPSIIEKIHSEFLEAGADIIETNSFNATPCSLSDYAMEDQTYAINVAAAKLAKKLTLQFTHSNPSKPRFVAGSIGSTKLALSIGQKVDDPGHRAITFDEMSSGYEEQIRGLIDGGVDILLIETVFDSLNCKAAIYAAEKHFEKIHSRLPIIISATIDRSGRLLAGQTLEAFYNSVIHASPLAIGLNCSLGTEQMHTYIRELAEISKTHIICYPNAGLPNQFGAYDQTPSQMADHVDKIIGEGLVNIIGGCCGTSPQHISEISKKTASGKIRSLPVNLPALTRLSGLDILNIGPKTGFVNIGERANVMGSKQFAKYIINKDFETALQVTKDQLDNGAQLIDVNMDEGMLDSKTAMTTFLNLVASDPDIAKAPIMVDSSDWEVILAGLKCIQGKGVVNSISLKEGEVLFKEKAREIKRLGSAVVVMAFDEKGQADTVARKVEICSRSHRILTQEVLFPAEDIIFDLNVFAVATGMEEHNNYAVNFIEAAQIIKNQFPCCHISGGISNLSFSFRGNNPVREAMHSIFIYHAVKAGLDMGIVNPGQIPVYSEINEELKNLAEAVILNKSIDATDKLVEFAGRYTSADKSKNDSEEWRAGTLEGRVSHALVKGITKYIEADMTEARKNFPFSLNIIEGPLMSGMNKVGELFGSGKMFLPQVIKSARVMKKAVECLTPFLTEEKKQSGGGKAAAKIVLATVKGDVHDIGKNIVEVVLACNNFEVINLGEMVLCDRILETALTQKADMIGLSGLITPSLEEMVHVAKEMKRAGFTIPLLIGGATTSDVHTAVKIFPEYEFVLHVKDASEAVSVVSALMNPVQKKILFDTCHAKYKKLQEDHASKSGDIKFLTPSEARKNKPLIPWKELAPAKPKSNGISTIKNFSIHSAEQKIDWTQFFISWGIKGRYPEVLKAPVKGEEATKLHSDAMAMLKQIRQNRTLSLNAVVGFFPANSVDDDIQIYSDDSRSEVLCTLYGLRQQTAHFVSSTPNFALSDFIAPKESGVADYMGFFALSAMGIEPQLEEFEAKGDKYSSLMLKFLANALSEAFAETLHEKVALELWGFSKDPSRKGIRPAPGYPAWPDHSEKEKIFKLLEVEKNTGIKLTETYMMKPEASICGSYIANPHAKYFAVGYINNNQLADYAERKNTDPQALKKWLSVNIL